jgi:hypothetical protein
LISIPQWRDTLFMRSRQVVQTLLLLAGIAILALLIVPAVHLPFVVLHGPMSALRAQRAASLLNFLLRAAAFLFAGLVGVPQLRRQNSQNGPQVASAANPLGLSCAMRC